MHPCSGVREHPRSMALSTIVKHKHEHFYYSAAQQAESAKLGMWLFLVTEVLLFSGLFVAYAVVKSSHPEMWAIASKKLDWVMGSVNTLVLITSSWTVALAVRAAQTNEKGENNKKIVGLIVITLVFALAFLGIKYVEYSHKIHDGLLPAMWWDHAAVVANPAYADLPANSYLFFGLYFCLTGLHGLHVLIGMSVLIWVMVRANKGHFYKDHYTAVEIGGLYWHLVDLIWIYLFPLLYLV